MLFWYRDKNRIKEFGKIFFPARFPYEIAVNKKTKKNDDLRSTEHTKVKDTKT